MKKRIKYLIAQLLNRRKDTCWSELVIWAEFGTRTLEDVIGSADSDCKKEGLCYCAKFCDGHLTTDEDWERLNNTTWSVEQ